MSGLMDEMDRDSLVALLTSFVDDFLLNSTVEDANDVWTRVASAFQRKRLKIDQANRAARDGKTQSGTTKSCPKGRTWQCWERREHLMAKGQQVPSPTNDVQMYNDGENKTKLDWVFAKTRQR